MIRVALVIAIVGIMLYRYRERLIDNIRVHQLASVNDLVNMLLPGDIVYMSSRRLAWDIHSAYAIIASAAMGTPFYHAFVVTAPNTLTHFVHDNYKPRMTRVCGKSSLESGRLDDYLNFRQQFGPIYSVFRRPQGFPMDVSAMCSLRFMSILSIATNLIGISTPTVHDAHCNSYIGIMLRHHTLLPRTADNPHRTFIPSRMISEHLPNAGFTNIGNFIIDKNVS